MSMLVSGDASKLGGPPPATSTISGSEANFVEMIAKNTASIIASLNINNGSHNGGTQNSNTTTTTQKEVINYWRQWVLYCFKCVVNLRYNIPRCPKKGPNHIEDSIFTDKKGGRANQDHLWQTWCKPITHKSHKVLPPGSKTGP